MTIEGFSQPQQGWQCPICKTVYSPSMVACSCQKNAKYETIPTTTPFKPKVSEGFRSSFPWEDGLYPYPKFEPIIWL